MNVSVYNDPKGNNVQLSVSFNEHYFPVKYTVYVNYTAEDFPGTKLGAERAHEYYNNWVSIFQKKMQEEAVK